MATLLNIFKFTPYLTTIPVASATLVPSDKFVAMPFFQYLATSLGRYFHIHKV